MTYFPHDLGSTDSELILLLMVMHGLEKDPLKAIEKTIAQILNVMQKHDVKEALRFTACLSSGTETIAIRFANDEHAPSLYTCHQDHAILVASEPLNDAGLGLVLSWSGDVSVHQRWCIPAIAFLRFSLKQRLHTAAWHATAIFFDLAQRHGWFHGFQGSDR